MIELMQGDCMQKMQEIPEGSIDLICTDIPYGTMQGIDDRHEWDVALPIGPMFEACARVLRPNGRCVLFSQEPLTSQLITQQIAALPFNYRAIWKKNQAGNSLMAAVAMVSLYEDINIFCKPFAKHDYTGGNPLRDYFKNVINYIGLMAEGSRLGLEIKEPNFYISEGKRLIKEAIGGRADHVMRIDSPQFALCTREVYAELISKFNINNWGAFVEYDELKKIQDEYQQKNIALYNDKYPVVFNLWQGNGSKSNVLEYYKDPDPVHPTQKPVALIEDIIKTFSNEGDTVLDFTMGSGSAGVAAVNTGRDFIGIELDQNYYKIAEKRIKDAQALGKIWII